MAFIVFLEPKVEGYIEIDRVLKEYPDYLTDEDLGNIILLYQHDHIGECGFLADHVGNTPAIYIDDVIIPFTVRRAI